MTPDRPGGPRGTGALRPSTGATSRAAGEAAARPADEALVAAYVAGDHGAFATLVDRYQRRVFGICYRYFGDPDDAEEAAQEAFVALLRRAETFTGAARFSTWMYRVATNACHDLARRRARRPRTVPLEAPGTPAEDVEDVDDVLARRELGLDLERALATLDPEHREAVVLHDVAGVGYADLAQRFGVPVGTVKSRVHRGHARLATALDDLRRPDHRPGNRTPDPTLQPHGGDAPPRPRMPDDP